MGQTTDSENETKSECFYDLIFRSLMSEEKTYSKFMEKMGNYLKHKIICTNVQLIWSFWVLHDRYNCPFNKILGSVECLKWVSLSKLTQMELKKPMNNYQKGTWVKSTIKNSKHDEDYLQ